MKKPTAPPTVDRDDLVLSLTRECGRITTRDVIDRLGWTRSTTRDVLARLVSQGVLAPVGPIRSPEQAYILR